jgi:hypothetical protein
MRAVLDVTDAAYYLHTTVESLRDLVKHRKIPYLQRGKKIYFDIEDLKIWIRGLSVVSAEEAIHNLGRPVIFPDTDNSERPQTPPNTANDTRPIRLARGAPRRKLLEL